MLARVLSVAGICAGSASRTRTYDRAINSRLLYQLSYRGTAKGLITKPDLCVKPAISFLAKKDRKKGGTGSRRGIG